MFYAIYMSTSPRGLALVLVPVYFIKHSVSCYIYYIQCHVVRTYIYTTYRSPPRRRRRRRGGGMNSYGQGLSQDSWQTQAQGDGDYGDDQQEEYYDEF